jgi:hypothetical protein
MQGDLMGQTRLCQEEELFLFVSFIQLQGNVKEHSQDGQDASGNIEKH